MSRKRSPHPDATENGTDSIQCLQKPSTPNGAATVPQTSTERLAQNLQPQNLQQDEGREPPSMDSDTVLYLAYGSNLCEETFSGRRGIRPLSEINVSAPTMRLTLSLPGIPYEEPCFANVDFRKLPKESKLPDNPKPSPFNPPAYEQGEWDGGLMGVVYEVTQEDYRQIIRTEGGGSGYKEIFVPCIPLPPQTSTLNERPFPELPRPVLARTLYAPYVLPDSVNAPGHECWRKLLSSPQRPNPDYAQASARYLKLITDGAREHNLPREYQEYLNSLQPYKITTGRQKIGRILLVGLAGPLVLSLMGISKMLADKDGKYPPFLATIMTIVFNLVWIAYDKIFKPIFGDGERTEDKGNRKRRSLSIGRPVMDEEKTRMLEDSE